MPAPALALLLVWLVVTLSDRWHPVFDARCNAVSPSGG